MAKHTFSEILAHFKSHMHTNLESAQQAVYDLGHERGREEAKAEFAAGVGDTTAPAKPAAGAPIDDSQKDAPQGQPSEEGVPHAEGQETTPPAEHAAA
jgi:hypothetical protein